MQIVYETRLQEIDRVLADAKASELLRNANTLLTLIRDKKVFYANGGAFIAQRDANTGGKVFAVPVMRYCCGGKTDGKEMSEKEIAAFVRIGGIVS